MNKLIKEMETIRDDYIKLADMARDDEYAIERGHFLEIVDLITDFINSAEIEHRDFIHNAHNIME